MRIGICTFHWAENYGAVLQALALQRALESLGHDAQIVDYRPFPPPAGIRAWLGRTPSATFAKAETRWRRHRFESFRRRRLRQTPRRRDLPGEDPGAAVAFDALVAGSDQIWNPRWIEQKPGMEDAYFLRFARPGCLRIAYAASFGFPEVGAISPAWQSRIAGWLKEFDSIGVREASGVEIVRRLSGREDARHVADPTLLLDRADYDSLAGRADRPEKRLFYFMLHGLEGPAEGLAVGIARRRNLSLQRCNAVRTGLHPGFTLPSPEGWLRNIRDAAFVLTNSFHCLVFCLIFRKPFAAVLIEGGLGSMNSRVVELLAPCGLEDRVLRPGEVDRAVEIADRPLDWSRAEAALNRHRADSRAFLNRALAGPG